MIYQRDASVTMRNVVDTHLLIPPHGAAASIYTLNHSGCLLWEKLATPRSAAQLAHALVAHYGLSADAATRDVAAFLSDMMRLGLVTAQEATARCAGGEC